jgi:acetolactate synthase regulatory subunit
MKFTVAAHKEVSTGAAAVNKMFDVAAVKMQSTTAPTLN